MKGIDISNYQAGLDLTNARSGGIEFAICKISEGRTYTDRLFDTFYRQATACGLPIGAYVYSHATTPDAAVAEARFALELLAGRPMALGIFMDVETDGQMQIPPQQLTETVRAFCTTVEAAGYLSGVYGSEYNTWARIRPGDFPSSLIWVAHYGKAPVFKCDLWQRTDSGQFPGYGGPVDTDEVMSERMREIIKGEGAKPEPTPAPEPQPAPAPAPTVKVTGDVILLQTAMALDGAWDYDQIDGLNTPAWREAFRQFAGDVLGFKL